MSKRDNASYIAPLVVVPHTVDKIRINKKFILVAGWSSELNNVTEVANGRIVSHTTYANLCETGLCYHSLSFILYMGSVTIVR